MRSTATILSLNTGSDPVGLEGGNGPETTVTVSRVADETILQQFFIVFA